MAPALLPPISFPTAIPSEVAVSTTSTVPVSTSTLSIPSHNIPAIPKRQLITPEIDWSNLRPRPRPFRPRPSANPSASEPNEPGETLAVTGPDGFSVPVSGSDNDDIQGGVGVGVVEKRDADPQYAEYAEYPPGSTEFLNDELKKFDHISSILGNGVREGAKEQDDVLGIVKNHAIGPLLVTVRRSVPEISGGETALEGEVKLVGQPEQEAAVETSPAQGATSPSTDTSKENKDEDEDEETEQLQKLTRHLERIRWRSWWPWWPWNRAPSSVDQIPL